MVIIYANGEISRWTTRQTAKIVLNPETGKRFLFWHINNTPVGLGLDITHSFHKPEIKQIVADFIDEKIDGDTTLQDAGI